MGRARTYKRWIVHVSDLRPYQVDDYLHLSQGQILAILPARTNRDAVSAALIACFQREVLRDLGDQFTASGGDAYWTPNWGNGSTHAILEPGGLAGLAATRATLTVRNGFPEKCVLHFRHDSDHELPLK